ncbi:MAG: hypothetical protein QM743_07955 [Chitinophagaceae bacterium]
MESLYNGRATVTESFNEITISIPTKKIWPVVIFMSIWLCAWLASLVFIAAGIMGVHNALPVDSGAPGAFLVFWLCAWLAGGLFTLRTLFWDKGQGARSWQDRDSSPSRVKVHFFQNPDLQYRRRKKNTGTGNCESAAGVWKGERDERRWREHTIQLRHENRKIRQWN